MNKKIMLINATDTEEIRVATLVDGVLSDYDIEFVHNEKIKGNIYKAKVVRADTSLQAAFIHYGGQKNGFLPIGELPRDLVSGDGRRGRIQDLLNKDQEIMVQVVREELGSKGAMVTAQISLPGRYLVLTPGNPLNGISRKIESREEREHFKRLIDELDIPKNFGVIVRTASLGVTKDDFQRDLEYLLDTYKEVQTRYKHRHGPGLVWQEDDVVTRTLRDGFTTDMEEVSIDDLETFHAAQSFFKRTMPQYQGVLKHYIGKKPLFTKYQTDEQIDRIYARRVSLPSGGALVLDQTEALVAVDVNSGKTSGEGVEDMAFKANMEAAEEAARQLRLRDLAGLIVIDFIDMKKESHNKAVMERLVDCLKEDKARMEVGKINRFGVLVMTRQRLRPSLQHVTHETCPICQGTGQVKSIEALVISVVRRLKSILSRDGIAEVRVKLAPAIAMSVLNQKRKDLADLEEAHDCRIQILADPEVGYGGMTAEIEQREDEIPEKALPARSERHQDPEEETVVLGGDTPISFEKALGQDPKRIQPPADAEIKYDRRDAQRAALDERERLRALFESAKPLDEQVEDEANSPEGGSKSTPASSSASGKPRSRRRGKGGAKPEGALSPEVAATRETSPTAPMLPVPSQSEPAPVHPVFDPSLVADLTRPTLRPKLSMPPAPTAKSLPSPEIEIRPAKRGLGKTNAANKKKSAEGPPLAVELPVKVANKPVVKRKAVTPKAETPSKIAAKTVKPKSKS